MSPSDHASAPSIGARRNRDLVMIAVVAGMATAAAFVLVQSLRTLHAPLESSASSHSPSAKPSVFGTAASSTTTPDVKYSPPQIAKAGNRAIVLVTGYDQDDKPITQGAGYVYSANGIVVTSYSAIRGASSVTVYTASGEELNVIALMGYSPNRDLAALAVLESNLTALDTGPAEIVQDGDSLVVLGPDNAISKGVAGPRRAIGGVDLIQIGTQAAAGSPVLNEHAKVIGLATRQTLAVPSHYISDMLAEQRVISFAQMLQETQPANAGASQ